MAKSTRYISKARKDEGAPPDFSDMSVIIPAAGMGSRMKSYGPKCMIKVNGISLLERQIKHINKCYPNCDIIVVAGFQAATVQSRIKSKYNVRIVHNTDYENTNVARSLFLGIQASISKKCLIVYGDLIFNSNAISDLYGKESKIVVGRKGTMEEQEVGVVCCGGKVTNFSYTLQDKWCQIAFLSGKELKMFERIAGQEESERWFGYEVLNQMLDNGARMIAHFPDNLRIFEIDSPKDIKKVRKAGVIIT
ncbi:hypothetical protein CL634_06915 [bacterium]|nr:hypothetical protein [bacterium]